MTIFFILGLPVLLALSGLHPRLRAKTAAFAPWAALPALLWAIWNPPQSMVEATDWFIGIRLGLDDVGRGFMIVGALTWITAGIATRSFDLAGTHPHRLFLVYLGTLTGTLGLFMAQNLPSFTLFYALMTFGAYGLIIVEHHRAAHRAGLTYLIPAIMGETLLLEAINLIQFITGGRDMADIPAAIAGAPEHHTIIGLLLVGFGFRLGAFPFHFWIPRAYTTASSPISAFLAGSMLMSGFLGLIRLLPLGEITSPEWGLICILGGLVALFYGFGVGLTQHTPGAILAYVLIAQAGLITAGIGMGLAVPNLWVRIGPLLTFHVFHLALTMGTLFLGLEVIRQSTLSRRLQRWSILSGLMIPAVSLAGAPFSSGISVRAIFETTGQTPTREISLNWLPAIAGFVTALLLVRFLIAVRQLQDDEKVLQSPRIFARAWMPWTVLVIGVGLLAWIVQGTLGIKAGSFLNSPAGIWGSLWPILIGGLVAWGMKRISGHVQTPSIPPGDLVAGLEWMYRRIRTRWTGINLEAWSSWYGSSLPWSFLRTSGSWFFSAIGKVEKQIGQWTILGTSFLFLAALLFALLFAG